jgi:hypothetical protein
MPAPVMTLTHTEGNLLASSTIAAAATATFDVDYSAKIGGLVQVRVDFGTVAATAGVQMDVWRRVGSGPGIDTQAVSTLVVAATASTTQRRSLALGTGRYRIKLTNLDASNSVSGVTATDDTVDSYA